MLRIAVCDDEEEAVRQHAGVAGECLRACGCPGEIARYTRSDQLLADIEDDGFFFDLILLDIEMPGLNGMELAERIKLRLPHVRIIFITSHLEYAIDAFELAIFRYVPKGDIARRLPAAICDAVRLIVLEDKAIPSPLEAGWRESPTGTFSTSSGMERMRGSRPRAACLPCAKACSRCMRSSTRRNSSSLTGAASPI